MKTAESDGERLSLRREAEVLSLGSHPGVVRLVERSGGDPPRSLVLAAVARRVSDLGPLSVDEIAGFGAAVATTLADLRDIGIAHRSIDSSHLLIDDAGRPVICGFGRAVRSDDRAETEDFHRSDIKALAAVLLGLAATRDLRLERVLRPRVGGGIGFREADGRRLAASLVRAFPSACLPGAENPDRPPAAAPARPSARRAWAAVAAGVIACSLVGLFIAVNTAIPARPLRSSRIEAMPSGCPVGRSGCVRVDAAGDLVSRGTANYRLLGAGEPVVGRWDCGDPLPALFDPVAGRVWVFDSWPADGLGVVARLAATVPGATSISVLPGAGRLARCDRIVVDRRGTGPTTIDPRRP